jgi:uncharacterized membrane protein required for colicin V production
MNHIDIAIIVLILASFAIGWKLRGVYVIIIPIAFFVAVLFANLTFGLFAKILEKGVPNEAKRHLIGYSIAFLLAAAAVVFAGMFLARGFDFFKLTFIDRALGAIILITVLLIPIYLLFSFMDNLHFNFFDFHNALKKSMLYPKIGKYVIFIMKLPVLKHFKILESILK